MLPFEWQSQTQDFSLLMSFSFDILTDQHLTCCIKMASLCQTLDIWYMLGIVREAVQQVAQRTLFSALPGLACNVKVPVQCL